MMRAPARIVGRERQQGGFLLEALIGILIFTLGVLGLMALQGRAIGYTSDTQYRGEAAYLANAYVAKMWADARANLPARYDDAGEDEYDAFQAAVYRLPGANGIPNNPQVTITQAPAAGIVDAGGGISLTGNSTLVTIVIQWQPPAKEGEAGTVHNYTMTSIIGVN
jgi:type IV pilus assembly protein PilV